MPQCRNLEVVLLPNKISRSNVVESNFEYTHKNIRFEIHIKYCELEIISIISKAESSCELFWECFRYIYLLQSLGIGYFYTINDITFSSFPIRGKLLSVYAKECREKLVPFYYSDPEWKHSSFLLADPAAIVNEEFLNKFVQIYETNNLRLIHNASLVQCSNSGINIEMRCAGIIQLFENLGFYDRFPGRKTSAKKGEWCLSMGLEYIFENYMIDQFFNNIPDRSIFIQKLCNTRNRIMHYDNRKDPASYLSAKDCAKYSRMLIIYYRYIILKKIGFDATQKATSQIEAWSRW